MKNISSSFTSQSLSRHKGFFHANTWNPSNKVDMFNYEGVSAMPSVPVPTFHKVFCANTSSAIKVSH